MNNIEKLAIDCGAKPAYTDRDDIFIIDVEQLEAFAKAYVQQSSEPFGYWHQGETYEESEFFLASESGDVSCESCIKLFTNPHWQPLPSPPIDKARE